MSTAARVCDSLRLRQWTVAVCESLTGGMVSAALTAVPGSSDVVVGGLVTYAPRLKTEWVGVEASLVESAVVGRATALAMAAGVAERAGSDVGVATTGVAGPSAHGGQPPGTVWIAVVTPTVGRSTRLQLPGSRDEVRRATVARMLTLMAACLET